jgi:hypothetical protein
MPTKPPIHRKAKSKSATTKRARGALTVGAQREETFLLTDPKADAAFVADWKTQQSLEDFKNKMGL